MATYQLDGQMYAGMVRSGAANLHENVSVVNDLNVFPIPDGDTGYNMCLTMDGGVGALREETGLGDVAHSIAGGMLLGARGNSGVILSQFFAGVAEGLVSLDTATVAVVAEAFRKGVDRAYKAVATPTEGTILTVCREATEYAIQNAQGEDIEGYMDAFLCGAKQSLDRTPQLLDVLREAGVVDSGGAGLVYIVEGMLAALRGEEILSRGAADASAAHPVRVDGFTEDSVLEFGYCTEFLLRLQRAKGDPAAFDLDGLIAYLNSVGNSVVAFRDGTMVKVHVHTMTPGEILNHCQQYGEFLTLKIENMSLQHTEARVEDRYSQRKNIPAEKPHTRVGVVAVACGEGLKNTFLEFGADVIVDGGQSMNPSSEDFLEAFDRANADVILVLPDNGNVYLAADQAGKLYERADVRVLDTHTVGEGFAALTMMDKDAEDIDSMVEDVRAAYGGVITGEISRAVRDASLNGLDIHRDEYIGIAGKRICVADDSRLTAACGMLEHLGLDERDVLIIIRGKGTPESESKELAAYAGEHYPDKEVWEIDGGQDVYDFILVSE